MHKHIYFFMISVFVFALLVSCKKRSSTNKAEDERRDMTEAKQKVLDSMNPPTAFVKNGESALVKIPEGYLMIIPWKIDLDNGRYTIWFSKNGNFATDANQIDSGTFNEDWIEIKGHKLFFGSGSKSSVYIEPLGEKQFGILKFPGNDPNIVIDAAKLNFTMYSGFDKKALKEWLKEQLLEH